MAQETESDFKPVTFSKKGSDGQDHEVVANSPADVVRLRFDGWREKRAATRPGSKPAATT